MHYFLQLLILLPKLIFSQQFDNALLLLNSTIVGSTDCRGYDLESVLETKDGLQASLKIIGEPCGMFSPDILELKLKVSYDSNRLRVLITDKDETNFQVPSNLFINLSPPKSTESDLKFEYVKSPFSFKVVRKSDGMVLFDTVNQRFVFQKEYMELSSQLPLNANIFGIGEVVDKFRRNPNNTIHAMWARDVSDPIRENMYGTHPFYIELRDSKFHGVHILNSYGMDVILSPQTVSYKALGGVFDFSFFSGTTHEAVMDQFTSTFGRPQRVNYWSLGFHQCRWGYKSLDKVKSVVENFRINKLPLETMWTDIDFMDRYKDFTFHPKKFPIAEFQQFVDELHLNHQRYVLIVDPGIGRKQGYEAYDLGKRLDVFLKNSDGSDYVGEVWPGYSVYPDWFHPKIQQYWDYLVGKFMKVSKIDGIWLDMNEPASFCFGSCGSNKTELKETLERRQEEWEEPQTWKEPNYAIHNYWGPLSNKTVATTAVHHNNLTEFQVHNLFGHMEALVTRNAILKYQPKKRPFLLSRSTFTGSGSLTGHWTGDNFSKWIYLYASITGVLSSNMFGMPFVGADICGFNNNSTAELCARWMQLGSLYPFARNHNAIWSSDQEPYLWPITLEVSRSALKTRYQLIPYLYTLMENSSRSGSMVWIPMSFKFFNDPSLLDLDTQFMVGNALMAAPVLDKGAISVDVQFPEGRWYNYHTFSQFESDIKVSVPASLKDPMPLFILGGNILPIKLIEDDMLTLHSMKDVPITLIVALDDKYKAEGSLYLDDGTSLDVGDNYSDIKLVADAHMLQLFSTSNYKTIHIDVVVWLGLPNYSSVFKTNKVIVRNANTTFDLDVEVEDDIVTLIDLNLQLDGSVEILI